MTPKTQRTLVLASSSPYRRSLLARLGVPFETASPLVDEERYRHLPPDEMVRVLSEAKAAEVAHRFPNAIIIGSDQCATIDGEILGKPGTEERAIQQLERLAGRTHRLLTGLCVIDTRARLTRIYLDTHEMSLRPLRADQIVRYVIADQPLDCAGSYRLEARGIGLFSRVRGDDPSAIEGLPLMRLSEILAELGLDPI
ncbi:MAG: septum formation protein Maf [Deltaproteobacteria bacterium]|nr:septum formation protein Maf [Deltaproteobacteria bacterium]